MESKTGKYLLYALGEIILIVIGILIALGINNSNENRKLHQKEQVYLAGLQDEFQTSKKKLENLLEVNRQNAQNAEQILQAISNPEDQLDEKAFSNLLYHTFARDIAFNPNNSLLNEMIGSGSLKDISNAGLRKKLTNWLSTIDDIERQEIDLGMQREEVLDLFRSDDYSLRTVLNFSGVEIGKGGPEKQETRTSNLSLLNSTTFENNLLMFMLTTRATEENHYLPLMADLEEILTLIREEMK